MFHETVSRKLLVFTHYVYPYMSKGVSHLYLLDKLITNFGVLFLVFFFFIQISSGATAENLIRRHLGYVESDLDLHCLPTSDKMEAMCK